MAPSSTAQSLPPSVEEAYRRKCALLKQRMADVEETNDAARVRLARLKRQVEKQRLERAFLLEQLAKRTSTNVEDSDGSPSPPPTPKDKPLRTKRGHRKASLTGAGEPGAAATTFINQNMQAQSPNSDAPSNHVEAGKETKETKEGKEGKEGAAKSAAKGKEPEAEAEADKPKDKSSSADGADKDKDKNDTVKEDSSLAPSGYELYCLEERPALLRKIQEEKGDVDMTDAADEPADDTKIREDLARGWKALTDSSRAEFEKRAAEDGKKPDAPEDSAKKAKDKEQSAAKDEDTEMADGEATAAATPTGDKE